MSEREYENSSKVWSGKDIVGIFHTLGITAATFSILKVRQIDLLSCLMHDTWYRNPDFLPPIPYFLQHTIVELFNV